MDGYDGIVILNPSETTLFRYGKIQSQKKSFEIRLLEANRQKSVTVDGVEVTLMANIEKVSPEALMQSWFTFDPKLAERFSDMFVSMAGLGAGLGGASTKAKK